MRGGADEQQVAGAEAGGGGGVGSAAGLSGRGPARAALRDSQTRANLQSLQAIKSVHEPVVVGLAGMVQE